MAKDDDINVDDVDLDDFDDGLFDGSLPDEVDDSRSPVEKVGKGVFSGALDQLTQPDTVRRAISDALPERYSAVAPAYNDVSRVVGDLYDTAKHDLAPYAEDVKRLGRGVMEKGGKFLPERMRDRINRALEKGPGVGALPSMEEAGVEQTLLAISEGQQTLQAEQDKYRLDLDNLREMRSEEGTKLTLKQLEYIRRDTARLSGYQNTITLRYQQKSLELKYRHLYVARDHFKAFTAFGKDMNERMRAVIKNTGLPDFLKLRWGETGDAIIRERILSGTYNTAGRYMSTFAQRTAKNLRGALQNQLSSLGGQISQATMGMDAMASDMPGPSGAEMAGLAGGSILGSEGAMWLAPKIRRLLERYPWLLEGGNRAAVFGNDYIGQINDFAKSGSDLFDPMTTKGRALNPVVNWLRSMMDTFTVDGTLRKNESEFGNMGESTPYTSDTDIAIREVIPSWLAKIHQRLGILTGEGGEESIFDPRTGRVENRRTVTRSIESTLRSRLNPSETYVTSMIDAFDPDGQLSASARAILGKYFTFARMAGHGINMAVLADEDTYRRYGSPNDAAQLAAFFSEYTRTDLSNEERRAQYDRRAKASYGWRSISNTTSAQEVLNTIARQYGLGALSDLGLTQFSNNQVGINFDNLANYLYSQDEGLSDAAAPTYPGAGATVGDMQRDADRRTDSARPAWADDVTAVGQETARMIAEAIRDIRMTPPPGVNPDNQESLAKFDDLLLSIDQNTRSTANATNAFLMDHHDNRNVSREILILLTKWDNQGVPGGAGPNGGGGGPGPVGPGGKPRLSLADFDPKRWGRTGWVGRMRASVTDAASSITEAGRERLERLRGIKAEIRTSLDAAMKSDEPFDPEQWLDSLEERINRGDHVKPGRYYNADYIRSLIQEDSELSGRMSRYIKRFQWKGGNEGRPPMTVGGTFRKAGGQLLTGYAGLVGLFGKGLSGAASMTGNLISSTVARANEWINLYVRGERRPRLLKEKLLNGEYIDANTRKVLTRWEDISGDVLDASGEIVLSYADYKKGLTDRMGKPVLTDLISTILKGYGKYLGMAFSLPMMGVHAVQSGIGFLRDLADGPQSVYVKGESSPRLVGTVMANGGYFVKGSTTPIARVSDITGPIVDINNKDRIALEDLPNLVDQYGKPFKSIKQRAGEFARMAFNLPLSMLRMTGRLYKGAFDVGRGLFNRVVGDGESNPLIAFGTAGKQQVSLLTDIRDILDERLEPTLRTGSWQAQRAAQAGTVDSDGKPVPDAKRPSLFGGGLASLISLITGRNKKPEEDDDEEGSLLDAVDTADDITDIMDGSLWDRLKKGGKWLKKKAGRLLKRPKSLIKTVGRVASTGLGKLGLLAGTTSLGSAALSGITAGGTSMLGILGSLGGVGGSIAGVLGGLFSAPVLVGAGVVAGAGLAGYGIYRWFRRERNDLGKLRIMEYGVNPDHERIAEAALGLETYCEDYVAFTEQGPQLRSPGKGLGEVIQAFGIDESDMTAVRNWMEWFQQRFKPVFLAHVSAKQRYAVGKSFKDLSRMTGQVVADVASATGTVSYNAQIGPLASVTPFNDQSAIANLRAAIIAEHSEDSSKGDKAPRMAAGALAATALAKPPAVSATPRSEALRKPTGAVVGAVATTTGLGVTARMVGTQGVELDPLMQIRLALYGLIGYSKPSVNALMSLERRVVDSLSVLAGGCVEFTGSIADLVASEGGNFGIVTEEDRLAWGNWVEYRFLPVIQTFISALHQVAPTATVTSGLIGMTWNDKLAIATALVGTQVTYDKRSMSVINVPYGPFSGESYETTLSDIKAIIDQLRENAKQEEYKPSPLPKVGTSNAAREARLQNRGQRSASGNTSGTPAQNTQLAQRQQTRQAQRSAGHLTSPPPLPLGAIVVHPGKGTVGDINNLPIPAGDGDAQYYYDLIGAVAAMAGVDPHLMMTMASIESRFKAGAKAPVGSATGLYQFIDSTWATMLSRHGAKYGLSPNASRLDPRASALMGAEFIKENYDALSKVLDRPVTDTDIYLAHFLGAPKASIMLRADSSAPANAVDPSGARNNPSIFFTKGGRARTVGELYQHMDGLVRKHSSKFAGVNFDKTTQEVVEATTNTTPEAPLLPPETIKGAVTSGPTKVTALKQALKLQQRTTEDSPADLTGAMTGVAPKSSLSITGAAASATYGTPTPTGPANPLQAERERLRNKVQARQETLRETMVEELSTMAGLLSEQLTVQKGIREELTTLVTLTRDRPAATNPQPVAATAPAKTSPQRERGRGFRINAERNVS